MSSMPPSGDTELTLVSNPGNSVSSPTPTSSSDQQLRIARVGRERQEYLDQCKATKKKPETFCNNEITTSKYNLIPFSRHFIIWKNLFEQCQRAANIYFLFIACIQVIPGVSPTGRFTTIAPLSLVMFLSLLKDAYEDYKRHKQDHELNSSKAIVMRDGQFTPIKWMDVQVGDIMKIKKNDDFPADVAILWTSEPQGLCYVETAQLDGETNLKIRKACSATAEAAGFEDRLPNFSAHLNYELPNDRLYKFEGNIVINGQTTSLSSDNIFLRGACLRNTDVAYGVAIYTGADTKLMKNASDKRHKMSNLDRLTNKQVLYVFIFQLLVAIIAMIGLAVSTEKLKTHWYLAQSDVNVATTTLVGFLTFLILFNNLIPISLYVSMEMVKLVQAALINNDIQMYHAPSDTPAIARTSALNEELGQVQYIFSDKTGTLTCNIMDFVKFSCITTSGQAVSYGAGITEIARAAAAREGKHLVDPRPPGFTGKDGFCFFDPKIISLDGSKFHWQSLDNRSNIEEFVRHLAVCHTVIAEYDETDPTGQATYQAASPDEGCLVKAARELGVIFETRTEGTCTIRIGSQKITYQVLNIIEFDSARKRMSVIVRTPEGKLQLLCKGADSVIYERILKTPQSEALHNETLKMLTQFAAEGLRTLVLAKADLNEAEYAKWAERYEAASCAVSERDAKMAALGEEIERDLVLVGTTAIEDKLQDQVPQTIELMISAGVKVWVLTGDKQETAINIGYACALLHNKMTVWTFDDCPNGVPAKVEESKEKAKENMDSEHANDMGLVIQGTMLGSVLGVEAKKRDSLMFLELATMCKSVICCRVSPIQKAQVVSLVRENVDGAITLSIGDGANDVPMIMSADVGVGIAGVEGLQAARASDYSIGQFKFLQRLMLIHGRWNYRRVAKLILYSFYKNVCLYLTQFWFCFVNGFSGQSLFDQWSLAVYNVWFSAFPIMIIAAFDQDVQAERLLSMDQFPDLFMDGIRNRLFNTKTFGNYIFNSVIQSLLAFFLSVFCLAPTVDATLGIDFGMGSAGVLTYSVVLGIVTVKVCLETLSWTWLHVWFVTGSLAMWFFFLFIYGAIYGTVRASDFSTWYTVPHHIMAAAVCWLVIMLVTVLATLRDFTYKAYRRAFNPELSHVIQILEGVKNDTGRNFNRADVKRTHPHLLGQLQDLKPKSGLFNFGLPSLSFMTGFAFSQEKGQADITKTLSRKSFKK